MDWVDGSWVESAPCRVSGPALPCAQDRLTSIVCLCGHVNLLNDFNGVAGGMLCPVPSS